MSAYWIAHVTVTDPDAYADYRQAAAGVFERHGGRFLARGGDSAHLEGQDFARHVVIEFPTLDAARACYDSPEYAAARSRRQGACLTQIVIVDGI
ncbi:DUF1330 domain-containing protein [Defluviimonas sp. WL0075]|uniref:DUF1330 domain-containing protein n=1 Tax=Albidovulum sediminicola TaxID=2984331 RepID=A0ABT2YWY2_9RHOB|nr:DUF1330 domain-containing protein [Defluviimonas sp. WL0075]MCV2863370.1 DUF1330 domain-containing protein [Defluviimonas sp. WL0075]